MNEEFEKILDMLEDTKDIEHDDSVAEVVSTRIWNKAIHRAKQIVNEVAEEYNGGWIPCSDRLPEENQEVMLQDFYGNITIEKMETNDGLEGFSDGDWWSSANNYVAWQPLPEPFKERD